MSASVLDAGACGSMCVCGSIRMIFSSSLKMRCVSWSDISFGQLPQKKKAHALPCMGFIIARRRVHEVRPAREVAVVLPVGRLVQPHRLVAAATDKVLAHADELDRGHLL